MPKRLAVLDSLAINRQSLGVPFFRVGVALDRLKMLAIHLRLEMVVVAIASQCFKNVFHGAAFVLVLGLVLGLVLVLTTAESKQRERDRVRWRRSRLAGWAISRRRGRRLGGWGPRRGSRNRSLDLAGCRRSFVVVIVDCP